MSTRLEQLNTRSSSFAARAAPVLAWMTAHADWFWMIGLGLAAALVYLQYSILLQPIPPDTTFHIYAGQQLLAGQTIYRDIAIVKAPLSDFVTAFALVGSRLIGISDIMGARLMFLLVAVATVSATYLAGRVLLGQRAIGVLAALVMMSYNFYGLRSVTGPEPKALLILFALLALILLAWRQWFLAGLAAGLATLAWQPALMVVAIAAAVAALAPSVGAGLVPAQNAPPSAIQSGAQRSRRMSGEGVVYKFDYTLRVLAGFAFPILLLTLYLFANDALLAARNAMFGANLLHLSENTTRLTPLGLVAENVRNISTQVQANCFPAELPLVGIGALGILGLAAVELARALCAQSNGTRRLPISLARTPLLLYAFGFAAFTVVDFNFCPDLIPLMPVLALGVGWLVWQAGTGLGQLLTWWNRRARAYVKFSDSESAQVALGRSDLWAVRNKSGYSGSRTLVRFSGLVPSLAVGFSRWHRRALMIFADPISRPTALIPLLVTAVAALLVLTVFVLDARDYRLRGLNFNQQQEVSQLVLRYLGPDERVLAFGNLIALVELHRANATKILHLGTKSGLGVLAHEPGQLRGLVASLDADPPKIVMLSREKREPWTDELYAWLDKHYKPLRTFSRVGIRVLIFQE